MRICNLLLESLSRVAYHYTGVHAAKNILASGEFGLSSTLGSVEEQYAPEGYPYFLSCTRTRHGGYHDYVGSSAVLFQLDGDWFNSRYPAGPVDYWLNRNPSLPSHRPHEAEDRVYSRKPVIPIDGITAVNLYVSPDADPGVKAAARQTLLAAKRRGIKIYFYTDKDAWRNFDPRPQGQGDISILKGQERTGGYVSTHPGYLVPWVQLVAAKSKDQLGKEANSIRYNLVYDRYIDSAYAGLGNEFSNARKPGAGPDRGHAVKLISYMRANGLDGVKDLVDHLQDKWKNIEE